MQLIPIYSTDSEPYFMEVEESQLATALNSVGWQLCPEKPSHNAATQHPPEWANGAWTTRDKTETELAADARKVWATKAEFWDEFTESEKLAIMDSTIPPIRLLDRTLLVWSGEVWSDDARVQAGLTGLVAVGILTAERKATILAK